MCGLPPLEILKEKADYDTMSSWKLNVSFVGNGLWIFAYDFRSVSRSTLKEVFRLHFHLFEFFYQTLVLSYSVGHSGTGVKELLHWISSTLIACSIGSRRVIYPPKTSGIFSRAEKMLLELLIQNAYIVTFLVKIFTGMARIFETGMKIVLVRCEKNANRCFSIEGHCCQLERRAFRRKDVGILVQTSVRFPNRGGSTAGRKKIQLA